MSTLVSVSSINSTHFVVAYRDSGNSNKGTSIIGTISNDDEISFGSEYIFNDGLSTGISVLSLNSTHFVVTYEDGGNSDKGTSIIGTISGSTISFGSEYIFNNAATSKAF